MGGEDILRCVRFNICARSYGHPNYCQPSFSSGAWINPLFNSTTDAEKSAASVVNAFQAVGGNTTFLTMDSFSDFFDTFVMPSTDVFVLS